MPHDNNNNAARYASKTLTFDYSPPPGKTPYASSRVCYRLLSMLPIA